MCFETSSVKLNYLPSRTNSLSSGIEFILDFLILQELAQENPDKLVLEVKAPNIYFLNFEDPET